MSEPFVDIARLLSLDPYSFSVHAADHPASQVAAMRRCRRANIQSEPLWTMNDYVHAVVSQRSCHQGRSANQRASKHLCEDCGNSSRRPDCGLGVPGAGPRSSAIHVHRQNARRDGLGTPYGEVTASMTTSSRPGIPRANEAPAW